jgi:probable rRNA maturation factor
MGEERVTDVLSFPFGAPPPGPLADETPVGEVILCVPVCERSARMRGVPPHDEVCRVLIHGVLHLLGHDHAAAAPRGRMRARERRYLAWYRRTGMKVTVPR